MKIPKEAEVIDFIKEWAEKNYLVRACLLTGSRAADNHVDFLSDYDVDLYVNNLEPFTSSDQWLETFGPIMIRWPLRPAPTFSPDWITRLVQFQNGVRIDFQITTLTIVSPGQYDMGYRILIDKDNFMNNLPEPTYKKYTKSEPSAEEYQDIVNSFWWDAIYVAKYLYRDQLPLARFLLDDTLRFHYLHKVIEWFIGVNYHWAVDTGIGGKYFKKFVDHTLWMEYEMTFSGAGSDENWQAFFNALSLFEKVAREVSEKLEYAYPEVVSHEVKNYCNEIYMDLNH